MNTKTDEVLHLIELRQVALRAMLRADDTEQLEDLLMLLKHLDDLIEMGTKGPGKAPGT